MMKSESESGMSLDMIKWVVRVAKELPMDNEVDQTV